MNITDFIISIRKEHEEFARTIKQMLQPTNTLMEQIEKFTAPQKLLIEQWQQQQEQFKSMIDKALINKFPAPQINDFFSKIEIPDINHLKTQKANFKIHVDEETKKLFDITVTDEIGNILYTTQVDDESSSD